MSAGARVPGALRTAVLTAVALLAFAGNSLLTRPALAEGLVTPSTFVALRLGSGAAALLLLWAVAPLGQRRPAEAGAVAPRRLAGSWPSAAALAAYAVAFTVAYARIGAAVGALVLFGAVQVTMVGWGLARGERPRATDWLGLALALLGFVLFLLPRAQRPDPAGVALMVAAGIAWGAYSVRGRGTTDPLGATAGNFARSLAVLPALFLVAPPRWPEPRGLALGLASGALASALGYIVWYAALPGLRPLQAGAVQLLVPLLAAAGGILLLGEPLGLDWALSAAAIVGGIALTLRRR